MITDTIGAGGGHDTAPTGNVDYRLAYDPAALRAIGLEPSETAVYEAALRSGAVTLDQLGEASGVDRRRLGAAVAALQAKGLLSRVPGGGPARYVAAAPDVALEDLLLDRTQEIERARLAVRHLASVYQTTGAGAKDPTRLVEIVVGRDAVNQRFRLIQRTARSEIRIIDKPPYVADTPDDTNLEQELLARGVRWRAIYDPAGLETFHSLDGDVQTVVDAGEQARVLPGAPMKLLLADDQVGMLPLEAAPAGIDSLIVVHPSALLEALSQWFEQLWRQAIPLWGENAQPAASPRPPATVELTLLRMLTSGMADDAIARRLQLSPRTLQRRVRTLLDRLDAHSRVQAVLRAVALGWLPIPSDPAAEPRPIGSEPAEMARQAV